MRLRTTLLPTLLVLAFAAACAVDAPDPEAASGPARVAGAGQGASDPAVGDPDSPPSGTEESPPAVDPVIERDEPEGAQGADSRGVGTTPATGGVREPGEARALQPPPPVHIASDPPQFRRPDHVKGIYLNAWTSGSSRRIEQLVALARRTEVNTFVIDLKDASGYVSYATGVPLAREAGATGQIRIADLPGLLRRLEDEGIYPIARIVVVKDPILVAHRPDLAVQDTAGGAWVDSNDIRWLNFYDRRIWDYHVDLAREAVRLGFPAIQWDYVRFADAPSSDLRRATYPGQDGRTKAQAVREFLEYSRAELGPLGVEVTADVFGVTTSARDVGIGQIWEEFIDVVDAALPMIYPSHYYRGSFGIAHPNANPYEVVVEALGRGLRRSEGMEGAGRVIPWLQDFTMGRPDYGAPEVRAQIQATYDVGIDEWILWNAGSRYTEEALEPVGGWQVEPSIRVAGRVVPVSERHEAIRLASVARRDSIAAARDSAAARQGRRVARPDTSGGGVRR